MNDPPDHKWLTRHSGATSARTMSAALTRMQRFLKQTGQEFGAVSRKDPYRVLVSCVISLRTRDEVTDLAASRLLEKAPDPETLARLDRRTVARLIYPAGFYRVKARQLGRIARTVIRQHGGTIPDTLDGLLALPGVGRKTANLVLTRGFGKPGICVDTHVHRISNRLGFVRTATPDQTEQVLRHRLPRRWWMDVNGILVRYGQTVCTPLSPRCSGCTVAGLCPKAGVPRHR